MARYVDGFLLPVPKQPDLTAEVRVQPDDRYLSTRF
jgi:hypothetical protein